MTYTNEPKVNEKVAEQAIRHIRHYGGAYGSWYVGIEEAGFDRDDSCHKHPMRYQTTSKDEAMLTMSWLLEAGLQADNEFGTEPTIVIIYTQKPTI